MRFKVSTLAVFALLSCTGEAAREAEECAVYQAFYEYWPVAARPQLRFARQARPHDTAGIPPVVRFEPGFVADPNNMHPPEFSLETSAYFNQLNSDAVTISDCFPQGGPTFIEESEQQEFWGADDDTLVLVLSPVALAPDGQHALVLTTTAGGEFYLLFERQGPRWVLKGNAAGVVF